MSGEIYDIIIVGGGPAGLTAGLYASRGRMKTLLLEKLVLGGQAAVAQEIENFPGFEQKIKGQEFILALERQARSFGLEIKNGEEVVAINQKSKIKNQIPKIVRTLDKEYQARAIIVATGARPRKLGVPGEERLSGRGVSYCATCDGPLFRNKDVVVVGGGNTAVGEALFLSGLCREVILVHRRDKLRATKILQERAFARANLRFAWSSKVLEVLGETKVEGVRLQDVNTATERVLEACAIFIFVGLKPETEFLQKLIEVNREGFIITDEDMRTSLEGIFACGDCRKRRLRQIVTACAEGAIAASMALEFVEEVKKKLA